MAGHKDQSKIKVYYDGTCPMCTTIMGRIEASSKKELFDLKDMHTSGSLPFSAEALDKEIHVVKDGTLYKGAEGILAILSSYPRLKHLAHIGNLFFIKPFLPIGYAWVAANRGFLFGDAARIFWLKISVLVAVLAGILLSQRLWLSSRTYPFVPIVDGFPQVPYPLDLVLFFAMIISLVAGVVFSRPKKYLLAGVFILLLLCALDQSRWQPWVFQYICLLGALASFSWMQNDAVGRNRVLNIARLVIASTYIFSGLQKINTDFILEVFPWFVQPLVTAFPYAEFPLHGFGAFAPILQVGFGVGLLTSRFRQISLMFAISMHVFILAMIGPFGHNWNSVVWPWTTAMIFFDLLLFSGKDAFSIRDILLPKKSILHALALVLFVPLPFLSFFNLWDSYLSSALYAGNTTRAFVYLTDTALSEVPDSMQAYVRNVSPNRNELSIQAWSLGDMNTMPYPETRVFKKIARELCGHLHDRSQLSLEVEERRLFRRTPKTTFMCQAL